MEGGRLNVLAPAPTYRLPPPGILKDDVPYDAFEYFGGDRWASHAPESNTLTGDAVVALELVKRRYKEETELWRGSPPAVYPVEYASNHVYPRPGQVRFGQ